MEDEVRRRRIQTVLIVDDEQLQLNWWQRDFEREGKRVLAARTRSQAMALARQKRPDLAIVDVVLDAPDSGLDVLRELKRLYSGIVVVLTSWHMQTAWSNYFIRYGADDCQNKPVRCRQLIQSLERGSAIVPDLGTTQSLDEIEWAAISRALRDCDGNVLAAASQLRLHPTTLRRKLKKRGLQPLPNLKTGID